MSNYTSKPQLTPSTSATSISSLKSIIRTPTGTIIRRNDSNSSTPGSHTIITDATLFTTWTEVFEKYPPPQVRVVAFQIKNEAQAKKEQLRSIVGNSYHDLLAAADTIIGMNDTAESMEDGFRTLAASCGSDTVRKRAAQRQKLDIVFQNKSLNLKTRVANARTATQLLFTAESQLRHPSAILVVAKLLVLCKEILAPNEISDLPQFKSVQLQFESIQQRYFATVSSIVCSTAISNVLDALVSRSLFLITKPSETLKYFLDTRLAELNGLFGTASKEDLVTALRSFQATITTTKSLFPSQFTRALTRTTILPVLHDSEIQKLSTIDFDFISTWCTKHVLDFTIHAAQDAPETAIDVDISLATFQDAVVLSFHKAIETIVQNISAQSPSVSAESQIQKLLDLRRTIFETLVEFPHIRPIIFSEDAQWEGNWLPTIRLLSGQYIDLVNNVCTSLADVVATSNEQNSAQVSGLWDGAWMDLDISRGQLNFRPAISILLSGQTSAAGTVANQIQAWWDGVETFRALVQRLKAVYVYDSFGGVDEEWINQVKDGVEAESIELQQYITEEIIPRGVELLSDKITELLSSVPTDSYKIGLLARSARIVAQLPFTQDKVKKLVSGLVDKAYTAFAEVMFPVNISKVDAKFFFDSPVQTGLWEEDGEGKKYPYDASPWISTMAYENFVKPVVRGKCEDVFLDFHMGSSVCRRVVGDKWAIRLTNAIVEYAESMDAAKSVSGPVESTDESEKLTDEPEKRDNEVEAPGEETPVEKTPIVTTNETETSAEVTEGAPSAEHTEKSEVNANAESETGAEIKTEMPPEEAAPELNSESEESEMEDDESEQRVDEAVGQEVSQPSPEHWIQLLFDVQYLEKIFTLDLSELQKFIEHRVGPKESKITEVVSKRVDACWTRTYLLYAV
ncbi:hypothetical protein V1512DRAFT_263601, partial [Lipomyces arxii]|uniref:uncharacterized protein n=1 Tax=Lipomyces arxii TaxID=56418 RepID=UPI0034CD4579